MRVIILAALLAAGCTHSEKQSVNALLEADRAHGNVTMTCRESSSGACHALFVTGDKTDRLSAPAGKVAQLSGITTDTQYCLEAEPPQNGCKMSPLEDGQQIVRSESARTE